MSSSKKIIAGLLGVAMVLTLVVGVAVSTASAQTSTYTRNLTVGSRGADVTALQTTLVAGGYLKVAPTGYFGALTKAALAAWQAASGITPAVGYFGTISRAEIEKGGSAGTPGCPPGALFNSMTAAPCGSTPPPVVGLDNTDGSLTVNTSTYVGSGVQIKKGESKDMLAVELMASIGKVAVNRFDVKFDVRPWLFFSKIELRNSNTGAIIASKNVTQADFTELTVGSEYLLRFNDLNLVVSPSQRETIVIAGTVLTTTDKIPSGNQTVSVSVPAAGVRTVNGKGYTDSSQPGLAKTASVTLLATGSNANIIGRTNSNSPAQGTVKTTTTGLTNGVIIGAYDLKAENNGATINSLSFDLKATGVSTSTLIKSLRLSVGGQSWNAASIVNSTTGSTTFTNLNINLAKDQWTTLTLTADVADQDDFTAGSSASTTLTLNVQNVGGVDTNFNSLTTTINTLTTNSLVFTNSGLTLGSMGATYNLVQSGNSTKGATVSYTLTATNNSDVNLYISKTPYTALATSTVTGATSTITNVQSTDANTSQDTSTYFVVSPGTPRTLNFTGIIEATNGTTGLKDLYITTVYYDDDTSGLQEFNINYGLEKLRFATPPFLYSS